MGHPGKCFAEAVYEKSRAVQSLATQFVFQPGARAFEAGDPAMMETLWKDIMNRCRFGGEFVLLLGLNGAIYPVLTGDVISVLHNPPSSTACTRLV